MARSKRSGEMAIRPIGEYVDEVRAKGLRRRPRIDRRKVPAVLHDLVPLAERWGISDGAEREVAFERASAAERKSIKRALAGRHDDIEDFLYSPEAKTTSAREAGRFTDLVVFELEYLGGAGSRGLIDHAEHRFARDLRAAVDRFGALLGQAKDLAKIVPSLKPALRRAERLRAQVERLAPKAARR